MESEERVAYRCATCGTKRFRKTDDGRMVCRYGHVRDDWQEEEDENTYQNSTRRYTTVRKIEEVKEHKDIYFRGVRKQAMLKRLVQYGVQRMARAFVHDFGFPSEFEYIVRELWIAYVTLSDQHLPQEYTQYFPTQEPSEAIKDPAKVESTFEGDELEAEFGLNVEDDDDYSDDNSDEDDHDDEDDNKPSNLPMDVDQSSDRVNDARDNRIWDNQIKMRGKKQWPKLSLKYSILLCYLGCLKIQQPVFLSDIRRWCVSLKLPYLKVLQSAGLDFMHRLGGWDGNMVPFCAVPKMSSLYEDACTLILRYREDAGIVFPPNNPVIVAQRLCSQFLLPTELVPCVLKVRRLMYDAYSKDSFIHAAIAYIEETAMLICILWVAHMCFSLKEPSLVHGRVSWLRMAEMNLHQRRKAAETDELGSEDVSLDMLTSYLTSASLVKSERGGALQLLGEDEYLAGLDAKANPRPNYMPIPSSMAKKTTSVDLQRLIAGCDTELELRPGNTSQSQAHRIMTELAADISLVDPEMVAIELRHLQRLLIKEYGED